MQRKPIQFVRELCKHKTEAEIQEAEDNFRRYLAVVKEICDDLEEESEGLDKRDEDGNNAGMRIISS